MSEQIEQLRAARDAASLILAAADASSAAADTAADAAAAAYLAANRLWRKAQDALEAAEREVRGD